MRPGALVLCHGPLEAPGTWLPVAERLVRAGFRVVVPQVHDDGPPYAARWVARTVLAVDAAQITGPVVLVAAGSAGPLLPPLGSAQRGCGRPVSAYLLVDAPPPTPAATAWLDLLRLADPVLGETAHRVLRDTGRPWPPSGTARPRGYAFWRERLPQGVDWPDAPCGYLDSGVGGPEAVWAVAAARRRGWAVLPLGADAAAGVAGMAVALAGW